MSRPPQRYQVPRPPTLFPRLASPGFLAQAWRDVLAHYPQDRIPAPLADFERRRAGNPYRSRIPADQKPPFNYRD